jgi:hypothetical protein
MPGLYSNTKHKEIQHWLNNVIDESTNPSFKEPASFLTLPHELRQAILLLAYDDKPVCELPP